MSVCKHCGWIGGYHSAFCARPAVVAKPITRVEWCGNIQVHQPVRTHPATKPQESTK